MVLSTFHHPSIHSIHRPICPSSIHSPIHPSPDHLSIPPVFIVEQIEIPLTSNGRPSMAGVGHSNPGIPSTLQSTFHSFPSAMHPHQSISMLRYFHMPLSLLSLSLSLHHIHILLQFVVSYINVLPRSLRIITAQAKEILTPVHKPYIMKERKGRNEEKAYIPLQPSPASENQTPPPHLPTGLVSWPCHRHLDPVTKPLPAFPGRLSFAAFSAPNISPTPLQSVLISPLHLAPPAPPALIRVYPPSPLEKGFVISWIILLP